MMRRSNIRARLVAGSVLAAAVVFAISGGVLHLQAASILASANERIASDDLTSFVNEIRANPQSLSDDSGAGVLIMVRDPHGRIEQDTLPPALRAQVASRPGKNEAFALTAAGTGYLVVGRLVATRAGSWSLWSARSTDATDLALPRLDLVLVIGSGLLLILFGVASWFLAGAALRPVEESIAREKQVISDAAHELRTPLAVLTTQLELAHDHFGDADILATQIEGAERSVRRLSLLAGSLLELSRIEARTTTGSEESATSRQIITELMGSVDRARMLSLGDAVDVLFTVPGDISDCDVRTSAQTFGRALDNLLANSLGAIKGESDGCITVSLSENPTQLVLTVGDTGGGMPATFIPHALERFSRADHSRTSGTGGSGLGLALVKAIVDAADGSITIRNTVKGLDVTLTFAKM